MNIDLKSILVEQFSNIFEHIIWAVPLVLVVAVYIFRYKDEIAYDFALTHRERNRLGEKSLMVIIVTIAAVVAYLYIKEHFFLLAIVLSGIVTYILHLLGILDMIVDKLEERYA